MMTFNINGGSYDDPIEYCKAMCQEAATNPDCTHLVWSYKDFTECVFLRGRRRGRTLYLVGFGKGKCAYKGRIYEGSIEYRDNKLYVGGEFVKEM